MTVTTTVLSLSIILENDLGTFEGFNFRDQSAIEKVLTAQEVVDWDHDREGEAEFWPSGDLPELSVVFHQRNSVSGNELVALDQILTDLDCGPVEALLKIHFAINVVGYSLDGLSPRVIDDLGLNLFFGTNFSDVRRMAAFELFELYFPDAFTMWEKTSCDGLRFDTDEFLDSPSWAVEEVKLKDGVALLIAPQ